MIYTICYCAIFLTEIIISVFYFETKFEKKVGKKFLYTVLIITYIILYSSRLLNLPWFNLLIFVVCNFFILHMCYDANMKSCIFHPCMLLILMAITESIVMFSCSSLFGVNLLACLDNSSNLIIQSIISKTLYSFTIYLMLKLSTKEYSNEGNKISLPLFILPVSSIVLIYVILYSLSEYKIEQKHSTLLVISFVLLFISNVIVFLVYEFTLKINRRNIELEIEQQKENATTEYYELLNQQNENTKIVIHDIKRHLNTIKNLAPENDNTINNYIESIIGEFSINNPIDYCNHALVNVITNRYKKICDEFGIKLNIDIRNTQIDFMNEPDITALLDNLLENAVEASNQTYVKFIDFTITTKLNQILLISVTNSVKQKVKITGNHIVSSKKSQNIHGVGLKSIKRIVNKYDGEINMNFNEENMTFTATVIFKIR